MEEQPKNGDREDSVFLEDDIHRTLLHAIRTGNTCLFKDLLNSSDGQADLKAKPDNLVFFAVSYNRLDILDVLLDSDLDLDVLYRNAERLMTVAVTRGYHQILQSLVTAGCTPWMSQDQSVLLHAAITGDWRCLEILLEAGCDTEIQTDGRKTPLHLAVERGHIPCAQLLLRKDADVESRDAMDRTPLHLAAVSSREEMLRILVEFGCKVNVVDSVHRTALHYSGRRNLIKSVQLLLTHNADPDIQDLDGNTALIEATYHNLTSVVQLLVQHNCDVNIRGNDVISGHRSVLPVFYAIWNANLGMVMLFCQAGCKLEDLVEIHEHFKLNPCSKVSGVCFSRLACRKVAEISLLSLCRIKIRKCLGLGIQDKTEKLLLPKRLKMFLQFKNLSGEFQI